MIAIRTRAEMKGTGAMIDSYGEGVKDGRVRGFVWGLVCGVWIGGFAILIGWNLTR